MDKRDEYLLKQAYEAGYLNASLDAADGKNPWENMPSLEADKWIKEVVSDNGGTTGQYICHNAPK